MSALKILCFCGVILMAACTQSSDSQATTTTAQTAGFAFETGSFDSLINRERARRGLGMLRLSNRLTAAALGHANDMSRGEFFSHKGSSGRSVGQRVAATGYGHCWVSENISWNRSSEAEVFARWMASPGHRRNMLARDPTEYGLAVAPGNYRVLVLGRPGC